ncbi:MAG: DUF1735 domain-containing protein [Haliscomenobacter sp.]
MKNLFKIVLFAFLAFSLTACLQDDPITDYSEDAIGPIILIPNGNWPSVVKANPVALDYKSTAQNIYLYARVSWAKPLDKDVTVTFEKDPAIITAYNAAFGTNYVELPAAAYKLPGLTVTIPAGTQEVKVPVDLFADKVDLSKNNMIAFKITSAGDQPIASNFRQIVFPVLVKNSYEASYKITGYFFHPSAPRSISMTKYLATVSASRCEGQLGDLGGWGFQFDISGATVGNWGAAGSTPASPSSGFLAVDNPGGIAFPVPLGDYTHANYPNSYDAGTKTLRLHYGYGGGSTDPNGWTRQIVEKWVRQ